MLKQLRNGAWQMSCDYCPEGAETEAEGFAGALETFKTDGWRPVRIQGDWNHACPDCAPDVFEKGRNQ